MGRTFLTAICVLVLVVAGLSAKAQAGTRSVQNLPHVCPGAMDLTNARVTGVNKRVVLVDLQHYINGTLQTGGLSVQWWRGNRIRNAGVAEINCWKPLPIPPRTLDYRLMSSVLCITLRNGDEMLGSLPNDPYKACPLPRVTVIDGVKWTTLFYRVVRSTSPPDGG
jgi:hypothetical protein